MVIRVSWFVNLVSYYEAVQVKSVIYNHCVLKMWISEKFISCICLLTLSMSYQIKNIFIFAVYFNFW